MARTLAILAISALLMQLAMATTYNAGGSNGWYASTDMQTWGSSQTFTVGDSIVFQYSPNHDVHEVSESDYDNCDASNPIQFYSDGNTVITLSSPGKRYFICGTPGHCTQGMKLEVTTLAPPPPPTPTVSSPPPPTPVTPTVSSPPPPTPVTPTVSSPPPASTVTSPPPPTSVTPTGSYTQPLTPSGAPAPSGISPNPPPVSSANECSLTLAFGFALIMIFAI